MNVKTFFALLLPFWLFFSLSAKADLLHQFSWSADNGRSPKYGRPVLSGSSLYGTTVYGGAHGSGTVYKVQTDGTGFAILHSFAGGSGDGNNPYGALILDGSNLYGMTLAGGAGDKGTIFKILTNGTGFQVLREFTGAPDDGRTPGGSLILSGTTLYGMTAYGGDSDKGTVFKIQTGGTGFAILHHFAGGIADGRFPEGALLLDGSTLFGMTPYAGANDSGTLFSLATDGSGFSLLHSFGAGGDGYYPYGSLALSGSTLYGMTLMGGASDKGAAFRVERDGSGYELLREFGGAPGDGAYPVGSPTLDGPWFYGMTQQGGSSGNGAVFRMTLDGREFLLLHSFAGGADDGAHPYGDLLISDPAAYGTTYIGGDDDVGTVFSLALPAGLVLVSPNGWERWSLGEARAIAWKASNYTGTVRLVLFKGGSRFGNIATGVPAANGSYSWTVGQTYDSGMAPAGTDYRLYLRSTDNTLVDPSDYRLALTEPAQLEVTAPNGGERWPLGATRNITWNANDYAGTVRLILFQKAAKIGQIVASLPADQGSYAWTVGSHANGTAAAGDLYSIRLLAGDGSQEDYSDGPFAITD